MKVLFFHAAASHLRAAKPVMGQVGNVLRPFSRYLTQAIHTAKQRQVRYQLPWERVRNPVTTIKVEPLDTLLRVPRRPPGVVLVDWPKDKKPDRNQPGFVPVRGTPIRFESATWTADGLVVRTDVPLLATDEVLWCMVTTSVRHETSPPPPTELADLDGNSLEIVSTPKVGTDNGYWHLVVRGVVDDCTLVVDGQKVEVQALPIPTKLRMVDAADNHFNVHGETLRVEEPPTAGLLRDENGVRYRWHELSSTGRRGCWVQLLPPDAYDAEEFLDPRAAFCEGDVREIWTQPRHRKDSVYKVKRIDQDRYQLLLDRYPPESSTLYLPVDLRNLFLQKRALRQLSEAPLPHHLGLLRLCEDPNHTKWPQVSPPHLREDQWRALTDASRSGTKEQRAFVQKALGSPDFAFLEGPPGSGKTTAICEIVHQLAKQGKRVLLCASTHFAIDNVLERLLDSDAPIDAVRIGRQEKVDEKVGSAQLDERVASLVSIWRLQPSMAKFGDGELEDMAVRTIIMAANLTCGTTMGIVNHPLFRDHDEELHISQRPITTMPHWDVLIVDEASKTLIQEFMVPALMAKRWIVVGDIRQLPPFADRADIVANLRDLVNEDDNPVFPHDHQRACLLRFRLLRPQVRQSGMRWLLVERPGVLEALVREFEADPLEDFSLVRLVARHHPSSDQAAIVTIDQLRTGGASALHLAAADWVLVGDDLLDDVIDLLPSNLLLAQDLTKFGTSLAKNNAFFLRQSWWLQHTNSLPRSYRDHKSRRETVTTYSGAQACETDWLQRNDLAQEMAWRITRLHELQKSQRDDERKRLQRSLDRLLPADTCIDEPIAEIQDIGLPSILEVLQEGIGVDRANRRSSLTAGFKNTKLNDFSARFESLSYQHRMHPDIASFPREVIYRGSALRDANTIVQRDAKLTWDFQVGDTKLDSRRVWVDLNGREHRGVNRDEIEAMETVLRRFIAWAERKGPPARELPRVWEVACLCFYVKQMRAISDMLRALTEDDRRTRFRVRNVPVEIVCGTVDRFQGREADLVMLSMRNTRRVGFLDSPNRLNVGVTRARQQLVIFGHADYFRNCRISELEQLAGGIRVLPNPARRHRRQKNR